MESWIENVASCLFISYESVEQLIFSVRYMSKQDI